MVGWLFIDDAVVAPLHTYRQEPATGLVYFTCSGKLLSDRTVLRGQVTLEHHTDRERRLVRCLAARPGERTISVTAVSLGLANQIEHDDTADDYLVVNGEMVTPLDEVWVNTEDPLAVRDLELAVPSRVWREQRGRRSGCLAELPPAGTTPLSALTGLLDLTPPLLTASHLAIGSGPQIELVRLRERVRYRLALYAADWQSDAAVVLARVTQAQAIGQRSSPEATREAVAV